MNIKLEDLLQLLGAKEVELAALRSENARLQQQLERVVKKLEELVPTPEAEEDGGAEPEQPSD